MLREMTSRFDSKCTKCGESIAKGESIRYSRQTGALHERCATRTAEGDGLVEELDKLVEHAQALVAGLLVIQQAAHDAIDAKRCSNTPRPTNGKRATPPTPRRSPKAPKRKPRPARKATPPPKTKPKTKGERHGRRMPNPFWKPTDDEVAAADALADKYDPEEHAPAPVESASIEAAERMRKAGRSARFAGLEFD